MIVSLHQLMADIFKGWRSIHLLSYDGIWRPRRWTLSRRHPPERWSLSSDKTQYNRVPIDLRLADDEHNLQFIR